MEFEGDSSADQTAGVRVVEGLGFDPFTDSPSVILDHVCDVEPGLFVQSVLEMLNPSALNPRDALRYLQVHDRVTSWWASRQGAALIAAAGGTPTVDEFVVVDRLGASEREVRISEIARDEIAAALRWGPMSTQARIDQARLLAGPLALTQGALSLGEITLVHVRILTEAAQRLSSCQALEQGLHDAARTDTLANQFAAHLAQVAFDADCLALQERVLPIARRHGFTRTKAKANRVIDSIDAAGQARRRAAARRHRDVYVSPDLDGLSTLIARLDTFTANAIMGAINAGITNPAITGSCEATIGERRSEALAALIFGAHNTATHNTGAGCPGGCTTPIVVNLSVDLTIPITELDLATNTGANTGANTGLSTDRIGCDWRQLLADPCVKVFARPVAVNESGHVLDLGRRRYHITGALRRMIITRDGTCRFPGCHANASRCQIDHVIPWDLGGGSDVGNLGALCVRHHQLKTHGGWQIIDSKPDGRCSWRSPQGFTYQHYPEPITEPQSTPRSRSKLEPPDTPDTPAF